VDAGLTKRLLDWLEYIILRNVSSAMTALPWRSGRWLADVLGWLGYIADRSARKGNAMRNLMLAFPDWTRREARQCIRRVYCSMSEAVLDTIHFVRLVRCGRAREFLEVEGFDKLLNRKGKAGIIFVTGHFGPWELLGMGAPLLGYPVWSMGRVFDNPFIQGYVSRMRQVSGQRMLPRHGVIRRMVRLIRNGRHVGMLIDQDARRHGIFVDFFGRPASTTATPARIAIRTGAPVAFLYVQRIPGQNRFRMALSDLIEPRTDVDQEAETHRITQRLTHDLEEVIRQAPEQWLWLHRRWRTYRGKYGRNS